MNHGVAGQVDLGLGADVVGRCPDEERERAGLGDASHRSVVERESTRRDVEGDGRGFARHETDPGEPDQLAVGSCDRVWLITQTPNDHPPAIQWRKQAQKQLEAGYSSIEKKPYFWMEDDLYERKPDVP